ncbi:hypothetical protein I6J18_00785 [Peribacillus psychrosaccharolyticus]|uniref:Uncharacterized protein n=1 Tax=Peribacillus psychrosaccharolyticus TaxID=1407 RepID=A0A974S0D3_PERPY|nr:hypothetical protein [Peribacillus psychrosaccharolyticus]MEC2056310.1 hypothetical protein [Peribacillus psychrosaccharolyticus]MED3743712.1 hypothetical protein [Peribacillus psychrosaccharolyticus]QQT00522.1 hypothetical protein I6J18_00785 [Peribacillus psychrosaccharolyticus]
MDTKLNHLQKDVIRTAKKGFPLVLSGAFIFFIIALFPFFFSMKIVGVIWILALITIFPLGVAVGRCMKINVLVIENPIGILAAVVAAPQAFFIPVFILVYLQIPEYLPFTIGLLTGSHFFPYVWIYKSKTYGFIAFATSVTSFILGVFAVDQAFFVVPLTISIVFSIGAFCIIRELRNE